MAIPSQDIQRNGLNSSQIPPTGIQSQGQQGQWIPSAAQKQNRIKQKSNTTDDVDEKPLEKVSQDHYRHIHEQMDFTLETLSMAGLTDIQDYSDQKIMHEFDYELDDEILDINNEENEKN